MSRNTTAFERYAPSQATVSAALAGSEQKVFWLDDLASRPSYPALTSDIGTDLAIVGGGYAGLWTAILAKERDPDLRVVVLEARRVGWAASGRNGGFCDASITHGDDNGISRWPEEFPTLRRLGLENLDAIEATVARAGIDCDFERTGTLDLATEAHQVPWLAGWSAEEAAAGDSDSEFLDAESIQAEVHSPTFLAAIRRRHSTAMVHPGKLVVGLAAHAAELGVEIFERTPVRLSTNGLPAAEGAELTTGGGHRVRATRVALATNAFPSLLKRNRLMTVPVYDYALMTEPLSEAQMSSIGWEGRQGLGDVANQFHYYRLTADNRILFGGYDAVYHFGGRVRPEYEDRIAVYRMLASHFLATFPQLAGVSFTHRWAGAIDTSSRFCAFFGTARDNRVAYTAGFTGLGVGATRFAANVMLDLLSGEKTELTELRMVRERPIPFPPEPAATVAINAMRWSLDRADHHQGRRNLLLRTADAVGLGFDS